MPDRCAPSPLLNDHAHTPCSGGGFLTDHFPAACKAVWDFEGVYASSRHIPGVRFAGLIHPGLIGTAPSHELLKIWNEREGALVEGGDKGAGPLATALQVRLRGDRC